MRRLNIRNTSERTAQRPWTMGTCRSLTPRGFNPHSRHLSEKNRTPPPFSAASHGCHTTHTAKHLIRSDLQPPHRVYTEREQDLNRCAKEFFDPFERNFILSLGASRPRRANETPARQDGQTPRQAPRSGTYPGTRSARRSVPSPRLNHPRQ